MDRTVFQGTVIGRSDPLLGLGVLGGVLGGVQVLLGLVSLGSWLILGSIVAIAAYFGRAWSRESRVELRVTPEGLYAGPATLLVPRSEIRGVRILPRAKRGPLIEIRRRLFDVRVSVRSAKQARELVRGLGFDAREGLVRFRVSWMVRRSAFGMWVWAWITFLGAAIGAGLAKGPLGGAIVVVVAIVLIAMLRQTITIGADGILIEGLFGPRFLRYADIRSIHRMTARTWSGRALASPGFMIWPKVGAPIAIHTLHERTREGMYQNDHLFTAARKLLRRKATDDSLPAALMRGSRSAADWLSALRAAEVGGYRSIVLDTEDLLRVVADPTAPEEMRAGAIAALSARTDNDARARLRVIAEDVATPALRTAIDAAVDDDEEKLLAALDEV